VATPPKVETVTTARFPVGLGGHPAYDAVVLEIVARAREGWNLSALTLEFVKEVVLIDKRGNVPRVTP